jgi:hypothetical protein
VELAHLTDEPEGGVEGVPVGGPSSVHTLGELKPARVEEPPQPVRGVDKESLELRPHRDPGSEMQVDAVLGNALVEGQDEPAVELGVGLVRGNGGLVGGEHEGGEGCQVEGAAVLALGSARLEASP